MYILLFPRSLLDTPVLSTIILLPLVTYPFMKSEDTERSLNLYRFELYLKYTLIRKDYTKVFEFRW